MHRQWRRLGNQVSSRALLGPKCFGRAPRFDLARGIAFLSHGKRVMFGKNTFVQHRFANNIAKKHEVAVEGLRVKVHLKGTFDDGEVFDDSTEDQPMTVVLGTGTLMPALDVGIRGMRLDEERTFRVENAFGDADDETRMVDVPRDQLPADCNVGSELKTADGRSCKVIALAGNTAKVHFTHPFLGKAANFSVKLISCEEVKPIPKLEWITLSPGDRQTFPQPGNVVTVHYTGMIAKTGAVFDSSRTRGEALRVKVGVGHVIQGWDDGLLEMSLGERCELRIPYNMAYGVPGRGNIPPSADLIFDVELLKIG